jgi:chloride channel protein, CIC family
MTSSTNMKESNGLSRKKGAQGPPDTHYSLFDYWRNQDRTLKLLPMAALVGIISGFLSLAFRLTLQTLETIHHSIVEQCSTKGFGGFLIIVVWSIVFTVVAVEIVQRICPEASGSGIPHLKGVLFRLRKLHWKFLIPVKFIGGLCTAAAGLTLGREGPTIQIGGASGTAVASMLRVSEVDAPVLLASGAAAGLAAAFNAPLAGVVFVLEELQCGISHPAFSSAFLAAAIADVISRVLTGQQPILTAIHLPIAPVASLPFFAICGIVSGALGSIFNRSLLGVLALKPSRNRRILLTVAAGLSIGLVAYFQPVLIGSGAKLIETLLTKPMSSGLIPVFFLVRFLLTIVCYRTGAAGGIFFPILVLGALVGQFVGELSPGPSMPTLFALAGMVGFFTAVVKAPLTGVVLMVEMTGNFEQMLVLLTSALSAFAVSEILKVHPIYQALLERDLSTTDQASNQSSTQILELLVSHGAPYGGKAVRELHLPKGCIFLTRKRGLKEDVVGPETVLRPGDEVVAVLSSEAMESISELYLGFAHPQPH